MVRSDEARTPRNQQGTWGKQDSREQAKVPRNKITDDFKKKRRQENGSYDAGT